MGCILATGEEIGSLSGVRSATQIRECEVGCRQIEAAWGCLEQALRVPSHMTRSVGWCGCRLDESHRSYPLGGGLPVPSSQRVQRGWRKRCCTEGKLAGWLDHHQACQGAAKAAIFPGRGGVELVVVARCDGVVVCARRFSNAVTTPKFVLICAPEGIYLFAPGKPPLIPATQPRGT